MRPVWTSRQILGNFVSRYLAASASADKRSTPDPILSWPFSANGCSHDDVVVCVIGSRNKPRIEAVRGFVDRFAWSSGAHKFSAFIEDAPGAQKIRRPSSGGGQSVEIFVREISLPHIDPLGQGTLPSPTAGSRIRFPRSLLMLVLTVKQRRRFVKRRNQNVAVMQIPRPSPRGDTQSCDRISSPSDSQQQTIDRSFSNRHFKLPQHARCQELTVGV